MLTNKVPNLKDELLKWVKRMSKYSQDVIRMLYMHQSEYISGQYIANQLNISRAAVKKVMIN